MLTAYNLIYPYFTQEEIVRFRQISRLQSYTLNQTLCSTRLDALWQPFLDRLHKMDPSISNKIPYEGKIRPWRYPQFEAGFESLSKKVAHEIETIHEQYPDLAKKYLLSLTYAGLSLLQQLEKQHEAIIKIKEEIAKISAEHALVVKSDCACSDQGILEKETEQTLCSAFKKLTV